MLGKESTRAYLYRVAIAVIAILAAYGGIASTNVPLFIALAAALTSNALAAANTSTQG